MSQQPDPDQQQTRDDEIKLEVRRIRAEFPGTGQYRKQMAALLKVLFFQFGERVGANRLVALLATDGQSPSASTAQDEINKFWEEIRHRSAMRFKRPGLPDAVVGLLAEMAEKTWAVALDHAHGALEGERKAGVHLVQQAQTEVTEARQAAALAQAGAERALQKLQLASEAREGLGRDLAAESARRQTAEARVLELTERLAREEQLRLEDSTRTHAALDKMKAALDVAVDEQRRLLAVGDDYKQQAARDRAMRIKSEEAQVHLGAQVVDLQAQVSRLSAERGILEGRATALAVQIEQLLEPAPKAGSLRRLKPSLRLSRPVKLTKLR